VLTAQKFVISNTGKPLDITDKDLFQRFKKGNQSSNGVGLGLAIVKQICQVNGFTVSYEYVKGAHRFAICFETKSIGVSASHTLPAYSYPLPESIA
jgi:signal transduction histidine kinase